MHHTGVSRSGVVERILSGHAETERAACSGRGRRRDHERTRRRRIHLDVDAGRHRSGSIGNSNGRSSSLVQNQPGKGMEALIALRECIVGRQYGCVIRAGKMDSPAVTCDCKVAVVRGGDIHSKSRAGGHRTWIGVNIELGVGDLNHAPPRPPSPEIPC